MFAGKTSPQDKRPHLPAHSAFSLIELIIAIAVIGILAAIMIPAIGGFKEKSLAAISASNLRQSSSYLLLHAMDNNNQLEFKISGVGGGDKVWGMIVSEMIEPGLGQRAFQSRTPSLDILYSPALHPYRHSPSTSDWQWTTYGLFAIALGDYSAAVPVTDDGNNYGLYSINLALVENPGNHPLLMDSVISDSNPIGQRMSIRAWAARPGGGSVHMRHNGHALAAFLDGSVRELGENSLKELGFVSAYDKHMNVVSF